MKFFPAQAAAPGAVPAAAPSTSTDPAPPTTSGSPAPTADPTGPDGTVGAASSSPAQALLRCKYCTGNHHDDDCKAQFGHQPFSDATTRGSTATSSINPKNPHVAPCPHAKHSPPGAPASCFGNLLPLPSVPHTPTLGAVPTQQPVATAPAVAHITSCPTQNARLETPAQTSSGVTVHAVTTDNVKGQPPTPKKIGPIPPPPPRA